MSQLHFCEIEVGNQEHRLLWPLYIIVLVRLEHNKGRWRLGIWHGSNDARSWACNQSISEGRKIQEGCLRGWGYGSEILVLRWWWWKWKGWLVRSVCEREEGVKRVSDSRTSLFRKVKGDVCHRGSVQLCLRLDALGCSIWQCLKWSADWLISVLNLEHFVYKIHLNFSCVCSPWDLKCCSTLWTSISEYSKKPQALQPIQCLFQYFSISKAWEKTSYKALRKIYFQSCADSCEKTLYLTRTEMHFTGGKFSHPSEYRFLKNNQHSRTKKWGLEVLFMEGTRN